LRAIANLNGKDSEGMNGEPVTLDRAADRMAVQVTTDEQGRKAVRQYGQVVATVRPVHPFDDRGLTVTLRMQGAAEDYLRARAFTDDRFQEVLSWIVRLRRSETGQTPMAAAVHEYNRAVASWPH
jgi:hypothetical protein